MGEDKRHEGGWKGRWGEKGLEKSAFSNYYLLGLVRSHQEQQISISIKLFVTKNG